mgnify:FL=1
MKLFSLKLCFLPRRAYLLFCLLSMYSFVLGQSLSIVKNVILKPPYSSNYSTFENLSNHAIITLLGSTQPMNIVLHGSLTNIQRDFRIVTKEAYLGGVFSLGSNQTKVMISDFASMLFLGRNNVEHLGIPDEEWVQILKTGQLPDGSYEFCVNAFWVDPSGLLVPAGDACFRFSISLAQAPVISSPYNGQELNTQMPTTIFTWTPPIGNIIGASIVYDLYIVKVPHGQNPNDVMNAAINYKANNPLIKTNLTGNQYVTQPYDLKIDSNTLYAVQVIARDIYKQVGFMNNGRSEVITFTKGKSNKPVLIITDIKESKKKPPKQSPGYTVTNVDPVPYSQLKGKLFYKFKDKGGPVPEGIVQNQQPSSQNVQLFLPGADNMPYNKNNIPLGGAEPLAGKKVSLVITYLFSGTHNEKNEDQMVIGKNQSYFSKGLDDADKVLATTVTGPDGSFEFNFVNAEKTLGLFNDDYSYKHGGEFPENISGKMYKVLRLRVENKYYCSPDVNIKIDPWKGIDLGTLVSYVKSYSLKVKVTSTSAKFWDMAYGQGSALPAITTTIIRKSLVASVPTGEGENTSKDKIPKSNSLLSSHETDKDGFVTFRYLVQHDLNNKTDRYYIKCVPDEKKGNFIFKEVEKSYYPQYDPELGVFPFNSTSQYTPSGGDLNLPITYGENITWNHQLEIKTYTATVSLYPAKPRIAGKLEVATNVEAKAMSGRKVVMVSTYKYPTASDKLFTVVKTNSEGRYEFNNLKVEVGEFHVGMVSKVEGPTRTLLTKPDGYKGGVLPAKPPYPPLKWGQQLLNQDFFLTPDGKLSGFVVDEKGNAVHADIDVDGVTKTTTERIFTYDNKPSGNKNVKLPTGSTESFSMLAPSGKRKITITPTDKAYAPFDTTLNIPLDGSKASPIKFVVFRSQKRIRFRVVEANSESNRGQLNMVLTQIKPIGRAWVQLDVPGKPIAQFSNSDGYVTFIFDNSGSSFNFIITTPEEPDAYEEGHYTIANSKNTLQTVTYGNAYLKKAATITGIITLGPDKKPLQGASIYVEIGGGKKIETKSNSEGKYVLNGIPKSPSNRTVWASKPGITPNIISQNKKITIAQKNELDFNLINDNELVIENIFGFDADIQSKTKQPDGTWLVSGSLINLPANDNFSLSNNKQSIPFKDVKIKKSGTLKNGIPVGVPSDNVLLTDLANIKLLLQNSFVVIQKPTSGDQLQIKAENQKGSLLGKMAIQKSSFQFTQEYVKFNDDADEAMLLTEKPGSFNTNLPSIEAANPTKKKFGVANLKEKSLQFKLLGFDAESDAAQSWVQDNSISLQTIIQINGLPGMAPSKLDINAGNLIIHPDKIEPLKGDQPIKFNLEKWQFVGNNWQLLQGSSSISIASGTIKTGSIDVPLTDISLKPDHLSIGNYNVNNLTLGGIIPVNVVTTKPVFGYNKSVGSDQKAHYELRLIGENGKPGVTIKSLPGMKAGDEMKFQNFSLVSNGEQIINPGNQPNQITFYSVMKVKPLSFTSGADYVNMDCGIDLNIPQLQETSGVIQFSKQGGQMKFMLYPLNVSLHGPGGVDFTANVQFNDNPQNLTEGKFTALGTIHDKEGIYLKGILNKTTQAAWIQVDPENQKMPLGSGNTSLANIKGKMEADMSKDQWKNFTFSGDMIGFTGVQGDTRKTFVVTGSINAVNQNMKVKNISADFAGIQFTYDIAKSRFTGSLEIDQSIGPLSAKGTAALVVDPGGWYFIAGAQLQTPGLGQFSAGILFGDYNTMPGEVSQKLMQYAYNKNLPQSFQKGISGFFFTGMKTLPISVPNVDINLVIIKVSFGVEAGLDARLWMNFADGGAELGIGVMAFAHAYLKGKAITCTKFYADARVEIGVTGIYNTSSGVFTLKGCGSFTISGGIEQCFPYPCFSDGVCCGGCGSVSASTGFKLDLLLDSDGNTDMSFGVGNCSGQK